MAAMSGFMNRYGRMTQVPVKSTNHTPVKAGELPPRPKTITVTTPGTAMSSFLSKFAPPEKKPNSSYTSHEEKANTDNERQDIEAFIQKFGRVTEEYKFFDGTVTLRFDKDDHKYFRIEIDTEGKEQWIEVPGVTSVVGIKDKSFALMPWAANETAAYAKAKFLELTPTAVAEICADPLLLQDWFFSTVDEAKKNYRELSRKATDIGKAAHDWLEHYIEAQMSGDPMEVEYMLQCLPDDPRAARCCEAAVAWMRAHNVRWKFTERKVYSKKYDCAGTCDGLCLVDSCGDPKCKGCAARSFVDLLCVIDWKSSNALYDYYRWQVRSYKAFLMEEQGLQITDYIVIQLGKDTGDFDVWHVDASLDDDMDLRCFERCLELYRETANASARLRDRRAERRAAKKAEKEAAKAAEKEAKAQAKAAAKEAKPATKVTVAGQRRRGQSAFAKMVFNELNKREAVTA